MSTPVTSERPHAFRSTPPLAGQLLDGGGVRGQEVRRVRPPAGEATGGRVLGCEVTRVRPLLADGTSPPEGSPLVRAAMEDLGPGRAPAVSWEADGSLVRVQVMLPPSEGTRDLYGAGLLAAPLRRNGRTVVFWNTDAWGYAEATPALYQSHPFVLAVRPDGRSLGIVADSTRRGYALLAEDGVELGFEREPFDLYLLNGHGPAEVVQALAALVGRIELPPLWALGYHQCRWSYGTADAVRAVARELRARRIPCDALWLDIDYMDRFRAFTWDRARFPDPAGLVAELRAEGFRSVAILDPGLAVDPDHHAYAEALAGGHLLLAVDGEPVRGRVWPGPCAFPDFARPGTRDWWSERVRAFVEETPLDGLWCDMNEPAVFRTPGRTLPDDARHRDETGVHRGEHARVHNAYGALMAGATRAGLAAARPGARPFVLTRANDLGGSRWAATWSGDNLSRWEDLAWSIPMILSLGLSGQPFAGADVPGFSGAPDGELFSRWFGVGALLPFFRGHGEKGGPRKEPWAAGAECEAHARGAIELRMRLLPYLYSLFRAAARDGLPVCRPLFFADPADARLRVVDDAFLLGPDLLVAPIVRAGVRERTVPLPRNAGGWLPFPGNHDGTEHAAPLTGSEATLAAPPGTVPLLVRVGSVVPLAEVAQHTEAARWPRLELLVALDPDGRAEGVVYEDDGETTACARGAFRETRLALREAAGEVELAVEVAGDDPAAPGLADTFVVHGLAGGGPARRFGGRRDRAGRLEPS